MLFSRGSVPLVEFGRLRAPRRVGIEGWHAKKRFATSGQEHFLSARVQFLQRFKAIRHKEGATKATRFRPARASSARLTPWMGRAIPAKTGLVCVGKAARFEPQRLRDRAVVCSHCVS